MSVPIVNATRFKGNICNYYSFKTQHVEITGS
jgi:hypothetical protein